MLRINPPTALLLLSDLVALRPGDWIIQNVANSAVGRFVIRLARARGVRTVNVVRRESLFGELTALGADVCVVDGPELAHAVVRPAPAARPSASASTRSRAGPPRGSRPASARAGVVCNYGSMSGEDPIMPRGKLVGDGQTLVGFILGRALATRSLAEIRAIYADLGEQVRQGLLTAPVEQVYADRGHPRRGGPRRARRARGQDPGRPERGQARITAA